MSQTETLVGENQVDNAIIKSSLMRNTLFSTSKLSEDTESVQFELKELQSQHIELGKGFGYFLTWVNDCINGNYESHDPSSPYRHSPRGVEKDIFDDRKQSIKGTDLTSFAYQILQKKHSFSIEELAIMRLANLEMKITNEEVMMEFIKAKHTIGILISDYLYKIEQLDTTLSNSFKQNDNLKQKLEEFMNTLRERNLNDKLSAERYQHLDNLMMKNQEYYEEEKYELKKLIEKLQFEKQNLKEDVKRYKDLTRRMKEEALGEVDEKVEELSTDMSNIAYDTLKKIKKENEQKKIYYGNLEAENSRLGAKNEILEKFRLEVEGGVKGFMERNNYQYKAQNGEFQKNLEIIFSEFERLEKISKEKKNLDEEHENLRKAYDKIFEKKKRFEESNEKNSGDLEETRALLDKTREDLLRIEGESEETIKLLKSENKKIREEKEKEKMKFENERSDLLTERMNLKGEVKELSERIDELSLENDQFRTKNEFLNGLIKPKSGKDDNVYLSDLELESLDLKLTLQDKEKENEHLRGKINNYKQLLKDYKKRANNISPIEISTSKSALTNQEDQPDTPLFTASHLDKKSSNKKENDQEIQYLKQNIEKLENNLAKLSADLFNHQRINKGLREINSQLRESYEKSTGNRTHTPIPSYATEVDKQTHPSFMNEQNDSFEGFKNDSDDEDEQNLLDINKNLNNIITKLGEEKDVIGGQVNNLKSQIRILEDNDLLLQEDMKKLRKRVEEIERENAELSKSKEKPKQLEFSSAVNNLEIQYSRDEKDAERIIELEADFLYERDKVETFKIYEEEFLKEKETLNQVIWILNEEKQYLLQLLRKMKDSDIFINGAKIEKMKLKELSNLITEIVKSREEDRTQGRLFEVYRTRYVDIANGRALENRIERNDSNRQRESLSMMGDFTNRTSVDALDEVQTLSMQIFDLENKIEELLQREEKIKSALLETLNSSNGNLKGKDEIEKESLIEKLSTLPENELDLQDLEPILATIYFLKDFLDNETEFVELDKSNSGEEKRRISEERTSELLLEIIKKNQERQNEISGVVESFLKDVNVSDEIVSKIRKIF